MAIIARGGDTNGLMSDINVTPLVDVMLVLLTVFIVTAPLLVNALSVSLPRAAAPVAMTRLDSVRISIKADGSVYLGEQPVPAGAVAAELRRRKGAGELTVEILADERVAYGSVARVMVQIQRAGISKFTFVMLPEPDRSDPGGA